MRDVEIQAEPIEKLDNMGLPSGLAWSKVILATHQRGVDLDKLVATLQTEFAEEWGQTFTQIERTNVLTIVSMAAAV